MKPETRKSIERVASLAVIGVCLALFFGGLDTEIAILKSDVQGIRYDLADLKLRVADLERGGVSQSALPTSEKDRITDEELANRRQLKIHMEDASAPAIKTAPRNFQYIDPDFYVGNVQIAARISHVTTYSQGQNSSSGSSTSHSESDSKNNTKGPNWSDSSNTSTHESQGQSVNDTVQVENSTIVITGEMINRSQQNYKSSQFAITLYDGRKRVLGFGNFALGMHRSTVALPFTVTIANVDRREVDSYKIVFINGSKEPATAPQPKDAESIRKMQGK
ncbi:MAG: hypothetical protein BIFFINMI_04314 [Phycisphaerae bacterium]|nr:hypothetical protein [Phycisphaerae bacterium]